MIDREVRAARRRAKIEERAATLFLIYYQMGLGRSLPKLCDLCTSMNLKMSIQTLKRYSTVFGWQEQLLLEEQKRSRESKSEARDRLTRINEAQDRLGAGMQAIAAAGLGHFQKELKKLHDANPSMMATLDLDIPDIVRLAEAGVKIQRLAVGLEIDRKELIIQNNNTWALQVAAIFMTVNDIPDKQQRKVEFANRVDKFIDTLYEIAK